MPRLFVAARFPDHWIAEHDELAAAGVFVMWPAEPDGWSQREVYRGNRNALREVDDSNAAYGTGWPGAPGRGRAPRAGVAAERRITIRLTPAEADLWAQMAGGRPLADWIRSRCNASVGLLSWVRSLRERARPQRRGPAQQLELGAVALAGELQRE